MNDSSRLVNPEDLKIRRVRSGASCLSLWLLFCSYIVSIP